MTSVPPGFSFERTDSSRHDITGEIEQYDVYSCDECGREFTRARWETPDEWRTPMVNHACQDTG